MNIETKFFGSREIAEQELIFFNRGIPGFEKYQRFVMLKYSEESPFQILQSVEKVELAFITIGLEKIVPGYAIDLTDDIVAELKLVQPEDAVVYAIVTITGEPTGATVNLTAPLCINKEAKLGRQIILNNPDYGLKHPLFAPVEAKMVVK